MLHFKAFFQYLLLETGALQLPFQDFVLVYLPDYASVFSLHNAPVPQPNDKKNRHVRGNANQQE
jgi:hypothetical protein